MVRDVVGNLVAQHGRDAVLAATNGQYAGKDEDLSAGYDKRILLILPERDCQHRPLPLAPPR